MRYLAVPMKRIKCSVKAVLISSSILNRNIQVKTLSVSVPINLSSVEVYSLKCNISLGLLGMLLNVILWTINTCDRHIYNYMCLVHL